MMEVHALGDALIKVGGKEIRPTSPLVFAALLYLGVERGRRVPRAALQELLFPRASERSGAHSLRQLLYKLRQLGATIESDASHVTMPGTAVEADVLSIDGDGNGASDRLFDAPVVLPNYNPKVPAGFSVWVEEFRQAAQSRVVVRLNALLVKARAAADQAAIERTAAALQKVDPFNEEATMARAETLALKGQKRAAVQMLESYAAEVGQTSSALRLPADVLRRRIEDRLDAVERNRIPLIGRDAELAALLAQFNRALEGEPTVSVVWGDAGIGKTRLVEELTAHLLLKRVTIETVLCQPHDAERPLGALVDVVPKLLNARGALGVAPEALATLRCLTGDTALAADASVNVDPEFAKARTRLAIADLLGSVAAERPLVLIIEDAHFLDADSIRLLTRIRAAQAVRMFAVMAFRGPPSQLTEKGLPSGVCFLHLKPLPPHWAVSLLTHAVGDDIKLDPETRTDCVALAAGNPLFLSTVAETLRRRGGVLPARRELSELLAQRLRILAAPSLLLMRFLAVLGPYGTPRRLLQASGLNEDSAILALQDLADRGLVTGRDGRLRCSHDLLTEAVMADLPLALGSFAFERVALILEADGGRERSVGMLYSAARCWRDAGNGRGALRVLRQCAAVANDLGHYSLAARLLDEAQPLADESEILPLIEDTIRVAELSREAKILIANIDRFEAEAHKRAIVFDDTHRYQLVRIHAALLLGHVVGTHIDILLNASSDKTRPYDDRVRASRTVIVSAMQELDRELAHRVYPIVRELVSRPDASFAARDGHLVYSIVFGNLDAARQEAADQLRMLTASEVALRSNIALAFQYTGDLEKARQLLEESVQEAEERGLSHLAARFCGMLADLHANCGRLGLTEEWVIRGERHLEQCGAEYGAILLYCRVILSLHAGNAAQARLRLDSLKSHREADAAHARRTIWAFEILAAHLEGTLDPATIDFQSLDALDDKWRTFPEHCFFAMARYLVGSVAGRTREARDRLRSFVGSHRRERYSVLPYFAIAPIDPSIRRRMLSDLRGA